MLQAQFLDSAFYCFKQKWFCLIKLILLFVQYSQIVLGFQRHRMVLASFTLPDLQRLIKVCLCFFLLLSLREYYGKGIYGFVDFVILVAVLTALSFQHFSE